MRPTKRRMYRGSDEESRSGKEADSVQSFPYAAGPMSAGGAAVPGIPSVGGLNYPPGVNPSLTQYPTAPPAGYPQPGFPAQAPYMMPQGGPPAPGTYQGYPAPSAPAVTRMPGPAMLGPSPMGGTAPGTGGVPGVSMGPVSGVSPPAATGGPHALPGLPQMPLPQGFPNPFEVRGLGPGGPQGQAQTPPMPAPGVQSMTGPQGYLPGLGYFGQPSGQGQPGYPGPAPAQLPAYGGPPQVPAMPGRMPMPPGAPFFPQQQAPQGYPQAPQGYPQAPQGYLQSPQGYPQAPQGYPPPPQGYPQAPQGYPQPPQGFPFPPQPVAQPAAQPPAQTASQGIAHPFWLQLAWQLIQAPAVKAALGDHLDSLLKEDSRPRTLQVAAAALAGGDMQSAFRAMTGGQMEQTRFTELFADKLKAALSGALAAR
jgi:hypothetical protein